MEVIHLILLLTVIILTYIFLGFSFRLMLAKFPRNPVDDQPDWGLVEEHRFSTVNGKTLECWVVYPDNLKEKNEERILRNKPAVLLIHGWGRNRGRMVSRARIYGQKGFTTILFSARDHGNSDKELTGMSIVRFSQDLEACVEWWGKPVIVVGHSIGGGAALIVTARNSLIRAVIAEAPPMAFPQRLKNVYRPILRWLTPVFMPGLILATLVAFRKHSKLDYSPLDASSNIKVPTFLIHGKDDSIFSYEDTIRLGKNLACKVWIPENTSHFDIEYHPDYRSSRLQ
ncbi:MAG: alpha/beta hydrolase [Candidatus Hodarchaeales archaeon]|jgi:pimeloyl-ACP methyl ester carboxylesterase